MTTSVWSGGRDWMNSSEGLKGFRLLDSLLTVVGISLTEDSSVFGSLDGGMLVVVDEVTTLMLVVAFSSVTT